MPIHPYRLLEGLLPHVDDAQAGEMMRACAPLLLRYPSAMEEARLRCSQAFSILEDRYRKGAIDFLNARGIKSTQELWRYARRMSLLTGHTPQSRRVWIENTEGGAANDEKRDKNTIVEGFQMEEPMPPSPLEICEMLDHGKSLSVEFRNAILRVIQDECEGRHGEPERDFGF